MIAHKASRCTCDVYAGFPSYCGGACSMGVPCLHAVCLSAQDQHVHFHMWLVRHPNSWPGVVPVNANMKTSWHAAADGKSWNSRKQRRPGLKREYWSHLSSSNTPQGSRTYLTHRLFFYHYQKAWFFVLFCLLHAANDLLDNSFWRLQFKAHKAQIRCYASRARGQPWYARLCHGHGKHLPQSGSWRAGKSGTRHWQWCQDNGESPTLLS